MKLFTFAVAAVMGVAMLAVPPAVAAGRHHKGHGWHWKKVCKTRYYHGHKGTWCRNKRVHW